MSIPIIPGAFTFRTQLRNYAKQALTHSKWNWNAGAILDTMITNLPVPYDLVGAFSAITNLRMDLFEALVTSSCQGKLTPNWRKRRKEGTILLIK